MTEGLILAARDFGGSGRWRWTLTAGDGVPLAEHEVGVDLDGRQWNLAVDLYRQWRTRNAPDEASDTARLLAAQVGAWLGDQVLGLVGEALAAAAPVVVRVDLPGAAAALVALPLDLATVGGSSLADRRVMLWFRVDADLPVRSAPPVVSRADPIRMLAVLSLPTGAAALNPYRERRALLRLRSWLWSEHRRRLDLTILQYGTTSARLAEAIAEGPAWDVVHLGGHGRPGVLVLEAEDGTACEVPASELVQVLAPLRGRGRLVTLAACESGAVTATAVRHLLAAATGDAGPAPDGALPPNARPASGPYLGSLATEVATATQALVVAMRHPVEDETATRFAELLYQGVLGRAELVPVAAAGAATAASGALPGLVVTVGSGLPAHTVVAPGDGPADHGPAGPDAPDDREDVGAPIDVPQHFVGRTAAMTELGRALAAGADRSGAVLLGMPGIGKSSLARLTVELRAELFHRVLWYAVPAWTSLPERAPLVEFAELLDDRLDGSDLVRHLADPPGWSRALAALSGSWQSQRVLLVVDDAEHLLDSAGRWREPRWAQLLTALTQHAGPSRLLLVCRQRPAQPLTRMAEITVGLLMPDEAVLLARELPGLRALLDGRASGVSPTRGRVLLRRVLDAAGGHPALLRLAEAQTDRPEALDRLAGRAAPDSDRRTQLRDWTVQVATAVPRHVGVLFALLCHLPEPDRTRASAQLIVDSTRQRLGRSWLRRILLPPAPDTAQDLALLADHGLLEPTGADAPYRIHPLIAEAGADLAHESARQAADALLAEHWLRQLPDPRRDDQWGRADRYRGVALAVLPYLVRLRQWHRLLQVCEQLLDMDTTYAVAATVGETLGGVAGQVPAELRPPTDLVLGNAYQRLAPYRAMELFAVAYQAMADRGEHRAALVAGVKLVELVRRYGAWSPDRVKLAEKLPDTCRKAGLGPWSQAAERLRLAQTWFELGQVPQADQEVEAVAALLPRLPPYGGRGESTPDWSVRENLAQLRRELAKKRADWSAALEHNAAQVDSQRRRRLPLPLLAMSKFNDYEPLRRLGRHAEAERILLACLRTFVEFGENSMIATCYGGLLDLAADRGEVAAALSYGADALRYGYRAGEIDALVITHCKVGAVLLEAGGGSAGRSGVAHLLAAALIAGVAARPLAEQIEAQLAAADVPASVLPGSVRALHDSLAGIRGVDLCRLLADLGADGESTAAGLRRLTALVASTEAATGGADTEASGPGRAEVERAAPGSGGPPGRQPGGRENPMDDAADEERARRAPDDRIARDESRGSPPKEKLCPWCDRELKAGHAKGCLAVPPEDE